MKVRNPQSIDRLLIGLRVCVVGSILLGVRGSAQLPPRPDDQRAQGGATAAKVPVPAIDGDYVLVYKPQPDVYDGPDTKHYRKGQTCQQWQPNDHTFIKGPDGRWHCFGITRPCDVKDDIVHEGEGPCFHAVAPPGLFVQALRPQAWVDQPKLYVGDCGWAPVALKLGDTYHMIGSDLGRAESKDLYHWEDKGRMPIKGGNRDPNVLFWDGTYHLVRCDAHGVNLVTSNDFTHWSDPSVIFTPEAATWQCESPTLLRRGSTFYLFWCLWDPAGTDLGADGKPPDRYCHRTYVYASDTPTDFHHRPPLTKLDAHAPEIVQDEQGNWFISSAEYPRRGVSVARLTWKD